MDFDLTPELQADRRDLDQFIAEQIAPLQARDDHQRYFDHRREWARTDFENNGLPRPEWEALLKQVRRLADAAGHLCFALYRHNRRYRITEGAEEIQMRKMAGHLFGYMGAHKF
jgi:alkylation response protein AidB-like acyl-CoA dehydrogenase